VAQANSEAVPAAAVAEVTLPSDVDLHARPAADFVRAAMRFESDVRVAAGEREVDAKSLLSVLALGARRGTLLRLSADGPDAGDAVRTLAATVAAFSE
jgi:phosphotransferase system HPr (HPr) family protein